ncbi:MAG: purine-nucleoside phosphorylase [Alphaproteobacteria bacterium]
MKELLTMARQAFDNAYAPYSNFKVGAALRSESGEIYAGANVENAAYPIGNCAEASAIAAMVAAGERRIVEAAVVAEGERLCTPCGGCRQRLAEFAGPDLPIHLASPDGHRQTLTLGELLPHAFDLANAGDGLPHDNTVINIIRQRKVNAAPRLGLILGSGLGGLADSIEGTVAIDYADLPGFPRPSVEGHSGRLVLGTIEGLEVACLQGRVHLYEGKPASASLILVQTLRDLGCETLIVTNAAGSLRKDVSPGSLVLIEDHINMLGQNPLTGPDAARRFVDMSEAYSARYREKVHAVALREGIGLSNGVYLATPGPSFETPAEIRAYQALGADLVGMSTVPEVIAARAFGMEVIGFSIVTNLAAGMSGTALSHEETLNEAGAAGTKLERLLRALFKELAEDG